MRRILTGFLLLCGAFSVPAASMAGSYVLFSRSESRYVDWVGDPLQDLILVQSTSYPPPDTYNTPDTSSGGHDTFDAAVPGVPADAVGVDAQNTAAIVAAIADVNQYCRDHYIRAYVVDCLAEGYLRVGRGLPYKGGYSTARLALLDAGTKLQQLALQHADPKLPVKHGPTGKRAPAVDLTPVAQPDTVLPAAALIVDGAQLVLLRSSTGSDQRRAAYQSIAAVVGSTKVLLRSARRRRNHLRAF